jgi:hypothetical protein
VTDETHQYAALYREQKPQQQKQQGGTEEGAPPNEQSILKRENALILNNFDDV